MNGMNERSQTVLVVDDEPQIVRVMRAYLEKAGFPVVSAENGLDALEVFHRQRPEFVILDLNLPGLDGLDVFREIRHESDVPVLMLTARAEEADRLIGLELGADDYVVKPFSPREVVARVRTVLRRASPKPTAETELLKVGDLQIDSTEHSVKRGGESIELTPTEFEILAALARQPRRVFSRLQLLEMTQGDAYEGYERTIDAHIKNIRIKIELNPKSPVYIHTVFGVGYKLEVSPDA
jgi:two-component system alkaline phosphatase synthesis response regulator PhoP